MMEEINLKLTKYLSNLYDMNDQIIVYDKEIINIKKKTKNLKRNMYKYLFKYSLDDIVKIISIKNDTIIDFEQHIDEILIYNEKINNNDNNLIIEYKYGNNLFKFSIKKQYPEANIYIKKDDKDYLQYNSHKEFNPLTFIKLKNSYIMDNYVSVFFKDKSIKLGIILIAYYYLIFFIKNDLDNDEKEYIENKDEIQKLKHIFLAK